MRLAETATNFRAFVKTLASRFNLKSAQFLQKTKAGKSRINEGVRLKPHGAAEVLPSAFCTSSLSEPNFVHWTRLSIVGWPTQNSAALGNASTGPPATQQQQWRF